MAGVIGGATGFDLARFKGIAGMRGWPITLIIGQPDPVLLGLTRVSFRAHMRGTNQDKWDT